MERESGLKFAWAFCVINLHVVRNLAPVPYVTVYVATVLWLIYECLRPGRARINWLPAVAWLLLALVGFVVTAVNSGLLPAAAGAVRFSFALPVYLAWCAFTPDEKGLVRNVRVMIGFFVLGALTIPLQMVIGPVSWFAAEGERGGFERYASVLGSITAFGVAVASYMLLARLDRQLISYLMAAAMLVVATLSLSKAAIANIALGLAMMLWIDRREFGKAVVRVGGLSVAVVGVISLFPAAFLRLSTVLESFGVENGGTVETNNDLSIQDSVLTRLVDLPLANFKALGDFNSPFVYLTGGGYGMGDTALVPLGYSEAPMAHNQFAEVISVFGLLAGGALLFAICALGGRLLRASMSGGVREKAVFGAFALLMVNSFFANGTLYQPAAASVFFFAVFMAQSGSLIEVETRPRVVGNRP